MESRQTEKIYTEPVDFFKQWKPSARYPNMIDSLMANPDSNQAVSLRNLQRSDPHIAKLIKCGAKVDDLYMVKEIPSGGATAVKEFLVPFLDRQDPAHEICREVLNLHGITITPKINYSKATGTFSLRAQHKEIAIANLHIVGLRVMSTVCKFVKKGGNVLLEDVEGGETAVTALASLGLPMLPAVPNLDQLLDLAQQLLHAIKRVADCLAHLDSAIGGPASEAMLKVRRSTLRKVSDSLCDYIQACESAENLSFSGVKELVARNSVCLLGDIAAVPLLLELVLLARQGGDETVDPLEQIGIVRLRNTADRLGESDRVQRWLEVSRSLKHFLRRCDDVKELLDGKRGRQLRFVFDSDFDYLVGL